MGWIASRESGSAEVVVRREGRAASPVGSSQAIPALRTQWIGLSTTQRLRRSKLVQMAIRLAPALRSTQKASVAFYPARSASASERLLAAQLLGGIVLRGEDGVTDALRLRADGWRGPLILDPANYEKPHSQGSTPNLFGDDPWVVDQLRARVAELLSPGSYVAAGTRQALVDAISTEGQWVSTNGSGRLSLVLDWTWLVSGLSVLIAELGAVEAPLAVALSDPNDPLAHVGAVSGLASLLAAVPNVMLLRADIAALGATAHGAVFGAIGTGTSVRHVVPPRKAAGGARTGSPSVFWPELLDWKLAEFLLRLPAAVRPYCHLSCCGGAPLDRFALLGSRADARRHNLVAIAHFATQLLSVRSSARAGAFKQACQAAAQQAARVETLASQPFPVRPQLAAWAAL